MDSKLKLSFLFLILLGVSVLCSASASTYYVAANGSDSNNGTSKTTPWLHAPGMPNCTGTCASTTPAAGDKIIFRGGDTWHFGNSGASPYTGRTTGTPCLGYNCGLNWTWSGTVGSCNYPTTTSSCIYIGVDVTWFAGGSFARPNFTQDNPIWANSTHQDSSHNGFVTSCSFDYSNLKTVEINANNIVFDNIEFVGMCWQSIPGYRGASDIDRNGTNIAITNSYFHGWTELYNPQPDGQNPYDQATMISGGATGASRNVTAYDVFDGSDTVCTGAGSCTGGPVLYSDGYDFHNNVCRYLANCLQTPGNVSLIHDNLFEYLYESYDPADHGSVVEVYPASGNTGSAYWYNNLVRHTDIGETFQTMTWHGATTYMFNNVFFDIGNGGNCIYVEQYDTAPTTFYFTNNTVEGSTCSMRISGSAQQPFNGTMYFQNNHFIGVPGNVLSGFYTINSGGTATITDNGNELFQTTAVANANGYCQAVGGACGVPDFAPSSGSGSTVHAGGNLSGSCATYSADSALCSGTSKGVTEVSSWGGLVAQYPGVAVNSRGSSWDIGAYQLQSSTAPTFTAPGSCPFTGIAPITVTLNDSNTGTHVTCYGFGTTPATNGSGTACSAGTQYSSSFTESTSGTVNAISGTSLLPDSTVASCPLITVIPSQSALISGSGTISGFGTLQAQASCIAFPTLSCSPTNTNTITYPSTAPSVGGTTGAGTTFTDPAFGTTGVRITDAAFDPSMAGNANNSFTVSNASSMDDIWWSTNDMLTLVTNQGGKKYVVGFNPTTMALARPYSASGSGCPSSPNNYSNCSLSGGWATGASGLAFSMVDPCTLYAYSGLTILSYVFGSDVVPWANPCSGGISGPPAATIVAANLIENLPVSCVGIACNCLPSDFGAPTWNDSGGGTTVGDALFSNAFSSVAYHFGAGTGQGSGFYVVIYSVAKGCMSYNTQTGAIQADVGWTGGSGLTCAAGQCSGTSTAGATFTLHNVKMNKAGTALALASTTCITGTCTYQPFIWIPGTTTVYQSESGGPANKSSGHWTLGYLGFVNDPGTPPYQLDYRLTPSSGSATTVTAVNIPPAPPCTVSTDSHEGWQMADSLDTVPFSFTRTTANLANSGLFPFDQPPCAWVGEIDMADRNGDGLVHREALAFNTNYSNFFNAANSIAECSQTGNFCSVGSDWFNIRNASGSSTSCIPSGPAWKASKVYATGYIVNPTSNNAANNSFKATSGGTAGGSTPNWTASCNSPGNTCADGSVTWTNLGVSSGVNQCGADAFAWRLR